MLNPRGFFRFVRNFFTHPGTWVFLALLAVGLGFALPFVAPALIIFAAVAIGLAAIATPFYLYFNANKYLDDDDLHHQPQFLAKTRSDSTLGEVIKAAFATIKDWAKAHPAQAFIVGVGIGLLITALVLTIGFFTGGAAFAFMAPVFAAIAAPFATAAASAGLQLGLAALAGTTFVLAALNITNIFKRLATWFDSFIYDYAAEMKNREEDVHSPNTGRRWAEQKENAVQELVFHKDHGIGYFKAVFLGAVADIKNGLASVDEDKLDPPPPPPHQYQQL